MDGMIRNLIWLIIFIIVAFSNSLGKGFVHKTAIRGFGLALVCTFTQYIIGLYAVISGVPLDTALIHQVTKINYY